jgi:hypothetical protein
MGHLQIKLGQATPRQCAHCYRQAQAGKIYGTTAFNRQIGWVLPDQTALVGLLYECMYF